jgi:predicted enzyme related to lactoylglutathione lyase
VKATMLLYPVEQIDEALPFFQQALGLPIKFRDGERFCALDAGGFTLGLVAQEERIVRQPALVYRVDDISATVDRLVAAGAKILQPITQGPHELRAVLSGPQEFPIVISAKLA